MERPKMYFIIILLLLFCTKCFAYENKKLTILTIDSPPYYNANTSPGEKRGVAIDIVFNAFKVVNTDVIFKFVPMQRAIWSINKEKCSALLGTPKWFALDENAHLIEFVDLLKIRFLFFYKKNKFPNGLLYGDLNDLKKYTIGNVRGSSTIPILEKADLKMDLVSHVDLNFKKLYAERIDLAVGVYLSGWSFLNRMYPHSVNEFATTKEPFFSANVSAIFLKKHTDLIEEFRIGLEKIFKNGTYKSIIEEYYGKNQVLEDVLPESFHGIK